MNRIITSLALFCGILVGSTAVGQTTKTSTQNVKETVYVDGYGYDLNCKETYTYYIDSNGNYLRHGTYSCSGSQTFKEDWQRTGNLSISYSYKATYKDGKLNGSVTSTTTVKGSMYKRYVGTANYNTSETSTKNYKDGKLNGAYKYTYTSDGKTEKNASVNYVDDKMAAGDFLFIDKDNELNMKGKIDEDGYYSYISIDNNRWEYKFIHGYIQSKIVRDRNMQTIENKTYNIPDMVTSTPSEELNIRLLENGYMSDYESILSSDYEANQLNNRIVRLLPSGMTIKDLPTKYYNILKPVNVRSMSNEEFEILSQRIKEILKKAWDDKHDKTYKEIANKGTNDIDPVYLLLQNMLAYILRTEGIQISFQGKPECFIIKIYDKDDIILISKDKEKRILEIVDQVSKEYKQKAIEKCVQTIKNALDEIIEWPSKDKSRIEAFYKGKGDNNLFNRSYDYTYDILKDWLPMHSYKIDSVYTGFNGDTCFTMCTINVKGKETNSYETYKTQALMVHNREWSLIGDESFKLKERIYNDWDSIITLRTNIRKNKMNIDKCESTYKDVWDEYNTHKTLKGAASVTIKEEELKQYFALYNNIIDTQMNYILFISSRKAIDSVSPKILASATDYKDIQKAYSSYYKACDFKIYDIKKDCQRMKQILDIQDSCLSFIELRKNIVSNNQKLATFSKIAKNIYDTYSSYFKGVDLTWTADNTCTAKLRNVISVQNQFLKVMTSPNISELDAQVKKMKDKSWESVLKQINK
ncbi:MAG: hypothetical protein J5542_01325 [Bacteroidales bacterium]|nr:hypothetical protein [Bacteroidales bacterium]